jgi:two-component sensor histidine kinase
LSGRDHVGLTAQNDNLVLSIADEGVGLDAKSDPRPTGMGQRIVSAMASKLNASVGRDEAHSGTRIVRRFSRLGTPAATACRAASWWSG